MKIRFCATRGRADLDRNGLYHTRLSYSTQLLKGFFEREHPFLDSKTFLAVDQIKIFHVLVPMATIAYKFQTNRKVISHVKKSVYLRLQKENCTQNWLFLTSKTSKILLSVPPLA